jgi:hypothetical protein
MGHIVNEGQDEHYRPNDVEFHRQLYKEKAMPFLRLETPTPSETDKSMQVLTQRIEQLEKQNQILQASIKAQDAIEKQVENIKNVQKEIEDMKAWQKLFLEADDKTLLAIREQIKQQFKEKSEQKT